MKKSIISIFLAFVCVSAFANYTFTQAFFDDHDYSTEGNFSKKNNNYREDAKSKRYKSDFSKDNSENFNCEYDRSGQVRCGDYKIKTPVLRDNTVSKQITAHYKKLNEVKNVTKGDDFNCALDDKDNIYCWGSNKRGQLGSDTDHKKAKNPLKVDSDIEFRKVYTKAHYACALDKEDHAYCWGDGSNGEVGNGEKGKFTTPQKVKTDVKFSRLSMARTYTCGVAKQTREVYCWGKSKKGTSNLNSSIPVKM